MAGTSSGERNPDQPAEAQPDDNEQLSFGAHKLEGDARGAIVKSAKDSAETDRKVDINLDDTESTITEVERPPTADVIPDKGLKRPDRSSDGSRPERVDEEIIGLKGSRARPLTVEDETLVGPNKKANPPETWLQPRTHMPDSYSQRVSDESSRTPKHYSAEGRPVKSDSGQAEVASAKVFVERSDRLTQEGVTHNKWVAQDNTSTGLEMLGVLKHLESDHPTVLADKDFRAEVITPSDEAKTAISDSGIFDRYGDKVVVRTHNPSDPGPEKGTLVAWLSGASEMPVHRLAIDQGEDGEPDEVYESTVFEGVEGTAPMVTAEFDDQTGVISPKLVDLSRYARLKTPQTDDGARDRYAPKLQDSVIRVAKGPQDPVKIPVLSPDLDDYDETVAAAMSKWPPDQRIIKNVSPKLEERITNVLNKLGTGGIMILGGRVRTNDIPPEVFPLRVGELSKTWGLTVDHVVELETIKHGAAAAGIAEEGVFVPHIFDDPECSKINYALVDKADLTLQKTLADQSIRTFRDTLTEPVIPPIALLERAAEDLAMDRQGESTGNGSISGQTVLIRYRSFIRANPASALDPDLPTHLSHLLNSYGRHVEAVVMADYGIAAAPHVNATAHVEKASALTRLALLPNAEINADDALSEAQAALNEAIRISPAFVRAHREQAVLSLVTGDLNGYAEALAQEQIYGHNNDTKLVANDEGETSEVLRRANNEWVVDAWKAIVQAKVDASQNQDANHHPTVVIERWPDKPTADGDWRPELIILDDSEVSELERLAAALTARNTAVGIDTYLREADPEHPQARNRTVRELLDMGGAALAGDNFAELLAKYSRGRILAGDAAEKLLEYDEEQRAKHSALAIGNRSRRDEVDALTVEGSERLNVRDRPTDPEANLAYFDGVPIGEVLNPLTFKGMGEDTLVIPPEVFNRHAIIAGTTGSGKTILVQRMVVGLAKSGIHSTIIDCGDRAQFLEMDKIMATHNPEGADNVLMLVPGDPRRPVFSLGLLTPEPGFDPQKHIDLVRVVLSMINHGHEPFPQLAQAALQDVMADHGYPVRRSDGSMNTKVSAHPDIATFDDFYAAVMRGIDKAEYGATIGADVRGFVRVRLTAMKSGPMGQLLGSSHPLSMADTRARDTVLSLHNLLNPLDKQVAAALYVVKQLEHQLVQHDLLGGDGGFTHLTHLSEGHHAVGVADINDPAQVAVAKFFAGVQTQSRGLREGFTVDTQHPRKLLDEFVDDASLKVIMGLPSYDERLAILPSTGVTPDDEDFGKPIEFKDGRAMVFRAGTDKKPVHAQIGAPLIPDPEVVVRQRTPVILSSISGQIGNAALSQTPAEVDQIEIALDSPQNAPLVVMTSMVGLARQVPNADYPKPLPEVQEWWDKSSERDRDQLLLAAADQFVGLRTEAISAHYTPSRLTAAVVSDIKQLLSGVPLAGTKPGREFVIPALAGAHQQQLLQHPLYYNDKLPDPNSLVPDDSGYMAAAGNNSNNPLGLVTVRALQMALSRGTDTALDVSVDTAHARKNTSDAVIALLGRDYGAKLFRAFSDMTHNMPDTTEKRKDVAARAGLWNRGDPVISWLIELLSTPARTIPVTKKSAK